MSKSLLLAGVLAFASCTDPAPIDHTVEWTVDEVNLEACQSFDVVISGPTLIESVPCTETSMTFTWTEDDPPTEITVDAMFYFIPFGCESMECWQRRSMAGGTAAFDDTADTTFVVLEKIPQFPF